MALRAPLRLGHIRTTVRDTATIERTYASSIDNLLNASKLCRICVRSISRYTCPKCKMLYCSLPCYRQHNTDCTELFARDHVLKEMESAQSDQNGRADSERLVQQMKNLQDEQSKWNDALLNDGSVSFERLEELALKLRDDVDVYSELTEKERKQFHDAIDRGLLTQYIRPWEPWWTLDKTTYMKETAVRRKNHILIIEDSDSHSDEVDMEEAIGNLDMEMEVNRFPAVIFKKADEKLLPVSIESIISGAKKPSDNLKYHLLDILTAYCITMRQYNGDWLQSPVSATETVFSICASLTNRKKQFSCTQEVLHAYTANQHVSWDRELTLTFSFRDASQVLLSKDFVLDALSDLGGMIRTGTEELLGECKGEETESSERKAKIRLHSAGKKVAFFLCWAYHMNQELYRDLNQELVSNILR